MEEYPQIDCKTIVVEGNETPVEQKRNAIKEYIQNEVLKSEGRHVKYVGYV